VGKSNQEDEVMIDSHDYSLRVEGTGEKTGTLTSADGLPPLEMASPPEFGGPAGQWSPEHLFAAAVAGCLMTTFRAIAAMSNLEVLDYSDDATAHLIRDEGGLYRIESITLRPKVVISDPEKVDKAHRLLDKAERACLISRSINAEVRMTGTVEVSALV
jgi:organic hydroperoxide reductase OsmC/OhrA